MTAVTEFHDIQISHNFPIPMRDGTVLRGDIYRPSSAGRWPVILYRFVMDPTDNDEFTAMGTYFSRRGYAFVYNDVRGCGRSDGTFFPLIDEAWGENRDGYDAIEWAAGQPWSNGDVGLIGTSYGAFNQYTTAPTRPPSLRACMPFYGSNIRETVFPGGIYRLEEHRGWAMWMALNCLENQVALEDQERVRAQLEAGQADPDSWIWHLPITECPQLEGVSSWHFEHLKHQGDQQFWAQTHATQFDEVDVPMLHVGGWYDIYPSGTLEHFAGILEHGRSSECRENQHLLIGPWTHGGCSLPETPRLDFGPYATPDFHEIALNWFDHWLKDSDSSVVDESTVRLFLMGENRWIDLDQWPPNDIDYAPLYLRHGTGRTASSLNNGHATFEAPNTDEQPDTFEYDPERPVLGHQPATPGFELDQRGIEGQLLTYTSETLHDSITVIGPVKAVLHASSSAVDTDWVVRLCDVWPDGRSIQICEGIVRARFRDGVDKESLLEPGQVYRYEIDMAATALTFLSGHRIRIHVTSSDFPEYDRNLNTGAPFGIDTTWQVAVNTVFHDAERPSHLLLPLVGRWLLS